MLDISLFLNLEAFLGKTSFFQKRERYVLRMLAKLLHNVDFHEIVLKFSTLCQKLVFLFFELDRNLASFPILSDFSQL